MTDEPAARGPVAWKAAWVAVAVSAIAACAAHAWLAAQHHPAPWTHLAAFALGWSAGRRHAPIGLGLACASGAVLPALGPWLGVEANHLPLSGAAAVLGWLVARPRPDAASLPPSWRWPIVTWGLIAALSWPLVAARELDFSLASLPAATANHLGGGAPADTSAAVAARAMALLTSLLLLSALWPGGASGRTGAEAGRLGPPIAVGLAVTTAVALYQAWVDIRWLNTPYWIDFQRAPGLLVDPNVLGAAAALAGPTLAIAAWARGGTVGLIGPPAFTALSLAAVMASGSRTALAAWALALACLVGGAVAARGRWLRGLLALSAAAALLLVLAQSPAPRGGNAVARAVDALAGGDMLSLDGLSFALFDRYGYAAAAGAVVASHPLWGVGLGVGEFFLSEYSAQRFEVPLAPDNAQNWWRHALVELGIVGGLAAWAASVAAVVAALAAVRRLGVARGVAHAGPLAGAGVMLLVGVATQHPFIQLLMPWLLVMAVAPPAAPPPAAARPPARSPLIPALIAVACAVGAALGVARPPERAQASGRTYGYGNLDVQPPPPAGSLWIGQHAVGVAPATGPVFVVRVTLPHEDLAEHPVDVVVSDRGAQVCRHVVTSAAPVECRLSLPPGTRGVLAQVDVGRSWRAPDGSERAALVTFRSERSP